MGHGENVDDLFILPDSNPLIFYRNVFLSVLGLRTMDLLILLGD